MGLLDDAIREHLDLKRRRGADPVELERAEREALGPVRREPFEADGGEFEPSGTGVAYDQEEELYNHDQYADEPYDEEGDWGDAFEDEPAPPPAADVPGARGLDDATRVMGHDQFEDQVRPGSEPPPYSAEPLADEVAPAGAEPPPLAAGPVGDETVQYDVDEAFAEEGEPRPDPGATPSEDAPPVGPREDLEPQPGPEKPHGDDVLEETPEFLQDAPDHDQLWFEQRPPRDFDFDG